MFQSELALSSPSILLLIELGALEGKFGPDKEWDNMLMEDVDVMDRCSVRLWWRRRLRRKRDIRMELSLCSVGGR